MPKPLIAVVGDLNPQRVLDPALLDAVKAKLAAEQIGAELARRGARLLVYGGPFLEADVVRGYVAAGPSEDRCILMWYSQDQVPPPFAEEAHNAKLFERRSDKGADWETAFYRSISSADGIILMGGGNAAKISGLVAIGSRIPILALPEFGGGTAKVWNALSAGEDLPTREEISAMAKPWGGQSASICVSALLAQGERRRAVQGAPKPALVILAALLFMAALSIVPGVWGGGAFEVWMLFLAPLLAGGAGAAIRPVADRLRGGAAVSSTVLATIVIGLLAGGIAGVLFVTAQLTGDPLLAADPAKIAAYARRSIPYALAIGFIAGLTADTVFGKLLGLSVVRVGGVDAGVK